MSTKKVNEDSPPMSVGAGIIAGMPTADPPEKSAVRTKKRFKVLRRQTLPEGTITTKSRKDGYHDVLVDGKPHDTYMIINGSGAASNYGQQTYGVHDKSRNKTHWIGNLQKTRRYVEKLIGGDEKSR